VKKIVVLFKKMAMKNRLFTKLDFTIICFPSYYATFILNFFLILAFFMF